MEEELFLRLQEVIYNEDLTELNQFATGSTGVIDPASEYSYYEEYDEYGNVSVAAIATKLVGNYMEREDVVEEFYRITQDMPLNDEEKKILFTFCVARVINNKVDQNKAMWQAEEYKQDDKKVDYYGTKNRAYNQGYDNYMEDHVYLNDYLLEQVVEQYKSKTK